LGSRGRESPGEKKRVIGSLSWWLRVKQDEGEESEEREGRGMNGNTYTESLHNGADHAGAQIAHADIGHCLLWDVEVEVGFLGKDVGR
jgi:hypothetical protein